MNGRGARYTKSHKPKKIIYQEEFVGKSDALKREAEIKSWTKAKKMDLIKGSL